MPHQLVFTFLPKRIVSKNNCNIKFKLHLEKCIKSLSPRDLQLHKRRESNGKLPESYGSAEHAGRTAYVNKTRNRAVRPVKTKRI